MMADVVESFLAALVIDQGLVFAQKFCEVCIFPKLLVSFRCMKGSRVIWSGEGKG